MPFGSQQWMYATGDGDFYPYKIDQSLRFNDDDSAYLSRSFSGIPETWTLSFWIKRGNISTTQILFAGRTNGANASYIGFISDQLYINFNDVVKVATTRLFRDPSAWYHIVVSVTENSTSYCYVNGEEVASWSEGSNAYLFSSAFSVNAIGRYGDFNGSYYDGYMAEVNFIDGQALDATDFGEFKSGVWVPKRYSGTYGTNGFYLSFADSANIGDDLSGNANDWTPTNLAATDQVPDSPTNNFATLNPLNTTISGQSTLSEGNLKTNVGGNSTRYISSATQAMTSGKWYCEVYVINSAALTVGIIHGYSSLTSTTNGLQMLSNGYAYSANGTYNNSNSVTASGLPTYSNGDVIGIMYDADVGKLEFVDNTGTKITTVAVSGLDTTVSTFFAISDASSGTSNAVGGVINFGQDSTFSGQKTRQGNTDANGIGDFYYAPPSGYLALCTANLPDPAIDPAQDDVPEDYFNTVLYTATGNDNLAITGVGFQPDFVWIKSRSSGSSHNVYDGVRGVSKRLQPDLTNVESSPISGVKSFDADGFTLGIDTNDTNFTSGRTYVAWNWKANGSGASNTDGTITSTVSANQKAGFSIVSWTGDGVNNKTVGHGLSEAPQVIIAKPRNVVQGWYVWTDALAATTGLSLNTTDAAATFSFGTWGTKTSTTIQAVSGANGLSNVNASGANYIAYCFHSVEGYSKFGSYTGNGSADGTFVYTGFRPAFVLTKRTDSTGNWTIIDTTRSTYNDPDDNLQANSSVAEFANTRYDILSNGIKMRAGSSGDTNTSGATYIYMAFAEMPFKYANAR